LVLVVVLVVEFAQAFQPPAVAATRCLFRRKDNLALLLLKQPLLSEQRGVALYAKPANRKKAGPSGGGSNPRKQSAGKKKNKKATTLKSNSPSASTAPQKKKVGNSNTNNNRKVTPPWEVLTSKDAKANIEKEKARRERAREGDHTSLEEEASAARTSQSLSKSFLTETEQRFLKWKRFNPLSAPVGMRFIGSYLDRRLPPSLGVPEIAFLGRSNVGKSSLLNRLSTAANQRVQARVGKTPGATASVNLYALMDAKERELLGWADLPGFGYAKLSKEVKEAVQLAAENYLDRRRELCVGILLVDIRRDPSKDDRAVLAALYDKGIPLVVVATKIDKISNQHQREVCLETIRVGLGLPEGQPLAVSSTTGEGTRDLWQIILEACEDGVRSTRAKYDNESRQEQLEEEEEEDGEVFVDDEDVVYSQGYDWVQGEDDFYDDEDDYIEDPRTSYDDDDDNGNQIELQRETLKSLRIKSIEMEKRGEL
jgi:GTP-binding protein